MHYLEKKTHDINLFAPCFSVWAREKKINQKMLNLMYCLASYYVFPQNFGLLYNLLFKWALDWLWSLIHYAT